MVNLHLYPAYDGSGLKVPAQYGGNNIELLGAAGGWVASAPELVKLIVAMDGFSSHPDILSRHSVKAMTDGMKVKQPITGMARKRRTRNMVENRHVGRNIVSCHALQQRNRLDNNAQYLFSTTNHAPQ